MTATKNYISSSQIHEHRNRLRKERARRRRIATCRFLVIFGTATAVFWWITLPQWVLKSSSQIKITGNELLSEQEIRSLIPLEYPQPILTLSGQNLAEQLTEKTPLRDITVTKKILPPSVTIRVEEDPPVAMAYGPVVNENGRVVTEHLGFINGDGIFIDKGMYENLQENPDKIPSLKMIGTPNLYLPYWEDLYKMLMNSPVSIEEINWQNPNNIILTTDLGEVHLGAYTSRLIQQLEVLAQLEPITEQISREDIVYIDLINPNQPFIKEKIPPKIETDNS